MHIRVQLGWGGFGFVYMASVLCTWPFFRVHGLFFVYMASFSCIQALFCVQLYIRVHLRLLCTPPNLCIHKFKSSSEGVCTSCVYTSWELRIHKTEVYTHVWTPCVYTSWELHICRTVARLRGPFLPTTSPPRKTFCRMPKTSARTFRYLNHGLNSSPCLPLLA